MDDFLREIEEDIKRQRWADLWQRYGKVATYGIAAILLAGATWQFMEYQEEQRSIAQTDKLIEAVKSADQEAFSATGNELDGVHHGFAKLIEAQLLTKQGEAAKADEVIGNVAKASDDTLPYDLARAFAQSSAKNSDIFSFTALEQTGWKALEMGKLEEAKKAFTAIKDSSEAPASMAYRAKAALTYISGNATKE